MKNNSTLFVIFAVLIVGAVGVYAVLQRNGTVDSNQAMEKTASVDDNKAMMAGDHSGAEGGEQAMMGDSKYVDFSPEAFEKASNTRRVLFFYANWCPTCQPAHKGFQIGQDSIPDDVTVIRVNYNDTQTDEAEQALARKYGVTYQHTYVQVDAEGNEVTKWNGGGLREVLENLQ